MLKKGVMCFTCLGQTFHPIPTEIMHSDSLPVLENYFCYSVTLLEYGTVFVTVSVSHLLYLLAITCIYTKENILEIKRYSYCVTGQRRKTQDTLSTVHFERVYLVEW